MAKWSGIYGEEVNFLCISVEGLEVARYFAQFTGTSINATMLSKEMPAFPIQLGCSGFVVIDKDSRILSTRTEPRFLDEGEGAFRAVETLLAKLGAFPKSTSEGKGEELRETTKSSSQQQEITLTPLPYVGHCDMDAEHAEIDTCLKKLVTEPTREIIGELKKVLRDHFAHEEELLVENKFGMSGVLSAYESHVADHQKILKNIDVVLESSPEGSISKMDIIKISTIIHQHGERFDSLYAKKVSCSSCSKRPEASSD